MFFMPKINSPSSIRTTLLGLLIPLMVVFMAIAWLIHGVLLERMARNVINARLDQEVSFLEQQIRQTYPDVGSSLTAGNYFENVFHHAFAIKTAQKTVVSPLQWQDALTPLLAQKGDAFLQVDSNPKASFLAYRKSFQINEQWITLIVAEDLSSLKNHQSELHTWTAAVSLGLLAILLALIFLALIFLAINLSLKPVHLLQNALYELQNGQRNRLDIQAPAEFSPLISQLNQLLDSLEQRLERSRQSIANLSHSVKTPISAVRQILTDSKQTMTLELRKSLSDKLTDIDKQLEAEMRRARFAGPTAGKNAAPQTQSRELIWMMSRLYPDQNFELEDKLRDEQLWPIEEHDFNEIIGNLIDNAGKWANSQIVLTLAEHNHHCVITVTDNGPGVQESELNNLGTRGMRLDQQTHGHGLGLSIVRDVVKRYQGQIQFQNAASGGLTVVVSIPQL